MITKKFQAKVQLLKWFTQPIHLSPTDFTIFPVSMFVRFSDHNLLNLNPNDSILDSKHIYMKFNTNMGEL